jgi:hypothetical protein
MRYADNVSISFKPLSVQWCQLLIPCNTFMNFVIDFAKCLHSFPP